MSKDNNDLQDNEEEIKNVSQEDIPDAEKRFPEEDKGQLGAAFLQEQLAKATKEASEFRDKYYRALAESENTRKRLAKEKQDLISYAIDNFICEMLTPLDNLENALGFTDNLSQEMQNWAQGFKMILGQFKEVLSNHGVRSFDAIGHPFDPHLHEAVETEEKEGVLDGTILAEVTKGYKHGERVIRVSRVKVAKTSSSTSKKEDSFQKANEEEL